MFTTRRLDTLHFMRSAWLLSSLLFFGSPELRASEPLRLVWQAPAECPNRTSVLARVQVPAETPSRVVAEAKVTRDGEGYLLVLTTEQSGVPGSRTLRAESCEELAEVTAALLSLALSTATAPATNPEPERPVEPAATTEIWLHFGARLTWGQLPQTGAGPELRLGYRFSDFQAEIAGFTALPQAQESGDSQASEHAIYGGELNLCFLKGRRFEWGGCLGLQIGAQVASGIGTDVTYSQSDLWLAPSGQIHLGMRWQRFSAAVRPGLALPLLRPSYRIEPLGEVFQPSALTGQLDLLIGLSF